MGIYHQFDGAATKLYGAPPGGTLSTHASPETPLRRQPKQDRSEQRVEQILDTLAALIDEIGYTSITVALLGKRAGMSGPAIYRYFDGVDAVARELAARNLDRLYAACERVLSGDFELWQDCLADVVREYAQFFRTEPGFRWLRLGDAVDRNLIDTTTSNRTLLALRLSTLFAERFEADPRPDLVQHAEVAIEIVEALGARAFEADPNGEQFFLDEAIAIIVDYLVAYLSRSGASSPETAEQD